MAYFEELNTELVEDTIEYLTAGIQPMSELWDDIASYLAEKDSTSKAS